MSPLGIRQNNPGNVRISPTRWVGMLPPKTGDHFCRFALAENGLATIAKILRFYEAKHGLKTIRTWITRWAPPADHNLTAAYIAAVASAAGRKADDVVSASDRATMAAVLRAIVRQENGQDPYTDGQMSKALDLAGVPSAAVMPKAA